MTINLGSSGQTKKKGKIMKTMKIEAETAKLAGLQIDLLQKVRTGKISLKQFEDFLNSDSKIKINLGKPPLRPFEECVTTNHTGTGLVSVELKAGILYIDDKKVVLQRSDEFKTLELALVIVQGKTMSLNSNVLDFLYKNQDFIPKILKDLDDEVRLHFCGSTFSYWSGTSIGGQHRYYIRTLHWFEGTLFKDHIQF